MKSFLELSEEEKLACISLYPEQAKKDQDNYYRLEAYRSL